MGGGGPLPLEARSPRGSRLRGSRLSSLKLGPPGGPKLSFNGDGLKSGRIEGSGRPIGGGGPPPPIGGICCGGGRFIPTFCCGATPMGGMLGDALCNISTAVSGSTILNKISVVATVSKNQISILMINMTLTH